LLAAYFKGKWRPLPWYYNALKSLRVIHPQLWDEKEVRCLHYILKDKPWEARTRATPGPFDEVNAWWWEEFDTMVKGLSPQSRAKVVSLVDIAEAD